MKRIVILSVLYLFIGIFFSGKANSQSLLRYPISELGFCRDAKECYLYCEIPLHKAACWSYGTYRLGPQVLGVTTMTENEKALMEKKAREVGVVFPVAELGNCSGPEECRNYCEQSVNQTVCMNFAKKHGFDKGEQRAGVNEQEILSAAQSELGCTSKEACFSVCEKNREKCEAFMKRHNLSSSDEQAEKRSGPDKEKMMSEAKKELGCTSMESCAKVCEQNQTKCMEFAKRHGFDKREERKEQRSGGPGGCASEDACRQYCMDHPSECPGYKNSMESSPVVREAPVPGLPEKYEGRSGGGFSGPSGCRTEDECRDYCKANPSGCPGFERAMMEERRPQMMPNPSEMQTRPGSGGYSISPVPGASGQAVPYGTAKRE